MDIMYRGNKPKIVPILIVVVIAALVIAALVSIGRVLFVGSDSSDNGVSESQQILDDTLNTAVGRAVTFTERGPIVANEDFKTYQITVSSTSRTYTTYTGYLSKVVTTKTYDNNTPAYEQFVHALDLANISQMRGTSSDDMRGVCATNGHLFVYETVNNDAATHTLWTSTCSGSRGNMGANVAQIKALFVNQIPDSDFDATYLTSGN